MADDRQASAELDALNRFAAFYLHDFKNLAARLSLVTQNAAKHGDDPEFRAEAMKTVGADGRADGGADGRSSRAARRVTGRVAALDLTELVSATLRSLGPDAGVRSAVEGETGQVLAVPEQLQQVLLNLVLNAKRAVERAGSDGAGRRHARSGGRRTRAARGRGHGSGIPPERLRTLFQPFQSGTPAASGSGSTSRSASWSRTGERSGSRARSGEGRAWWWSCPAIAGEAAVMQTSGAAKEKAP